MTKLVLALSILVALLLVTGCSKTPQDARKELGAMNVEYSPESFIKSVRNGDVVAVELFLEAGMNPQNLYELEGLKVTPLRIALAYGHAEIAQLLVDQGADVNDRSSYDKRTALSTIYASDALRTNKSLQEDLALRMINKGADPNAGFEEEDRPLNWAVSEQHVEVVRALLDKGAKVNDSVVRDAERRASTVEGQQIAEMVKNAKR
jgi:ankyrin repeat protein